MSKSHTLLYILQYELVKITQGPGAGSVPQRTTSCSNHFKDDQHSSHSATLFCVVSARNCLFEHHLDVGESFVMVFSFFSQQAFSEDDLADLHGKVVIVTGAK
jgi:hypothetical protein